MKRLLIWRVTLPLLILSLITNVKSDVTPQGQQKNKQNPDSKNISIPSSPQFIIESWDSLKGLQQNTIIALAQSPDGFLWVGTQEGVARFDGVKFTPYNDTEQWIRQDLWVFAMTAAQDGSIWVATGVGLNRLKDGKFTAYTNQSSPPGTIGNLPDNHIEALCEDIEGAIWIATPQGLTRYFQSKFTTLTTRDGLSSNRIHRLIRSKSGGVWIGTENGLSRYKDGKFTNYGVHEGLAGDHIAHLMEDRQGGVWVGTQKQGLIRFDGARFTTFTEQEGLSSNSICGLTEDQDGRIWIGTKEGLNYLENGRISQFPEKDAPFKNFITSLMCDSEGNLWVGTGANGIYRVRKSKFQVLGKPEGLTDSAIDAVLEAKDGSIWVATDKGLNRIKDNKIEQWLTKDGLPDNSMTALFESRDGSIWIGTMTGLGRYSGGRITNYRLKDGLSDLRMMAAAEEEDGTIWFGTAQGLTRYKDGKFEPFMNDGVLGEATITNIKVLKSNGEIWLTSPNEGLFRIKGGALTQFTTADGLPTNLLNSVTEDDAGNLWIGTESGLVRYREGKFRTYSTKQGLPRKQVFAVIVDDFGALWMSSNHGIMRVPREELDRLDQGAITHLNVIDYGLADGMRSEECNAGGQPIAWKNRDGRLLFPTINGLVIINPSNLFSMMQPPPVFIERVLADKAPMEISDQIEIDPHSRELQIDFTAISISAPEKVRFRYRLVGFDKDWVDSQSRRFAVYNNLPPGNYTFYVTASNAEGKWNLVGSTINIRLNPLIYKTWWFYLLCALGVTAAVYGMHRYKLRKENDRLLQNIVTLLPTALAVSDDRDTVTMLNAQFNQHFGYTKRDIQTLDDWFFLAYPDEKDRNLAREKWRKTAENCASPENGHYESQVRTKDGAVRDIEFQFAEIQSNLVVTFNDVTERNRTEKKLSELAARLQTIREEERKFISREIHDELGQLLTGLKLEVQWLENRLAPDARILREKTTTILELINDTIKAMRNIATEFRPSILDSFGLMEAIEWQVEDFESRSGIRCDILEKTDTSVIERDRATALFRILQESLTNVARHANATVVIVSLTQEDGNLVLQIEDDGRGITDREIAGSHSLGLLGMRERVRQFNGDVNISGVAGEGTTITASIPIKPQKALAVIS
jgi:PAS domain S-box-containing protein